MAGRVTGGGGAMSLEGIISNPVKVLKHVLSKFSLGKRETVEGSSLTKVFSLPIAKR